jgi:hypothetical protein
MCPAYGQGVVIPSAGQFVIDLVSPALDLAMADSETDAQMIQSMINDEMTS